MKKFVRYLYAYQDRRRTRNVGFVKCEMDEQKAAVQIYGKGFPVNGNDMYELFMFYPQDDRCVGISMGTLKNVSPVFSYRLEFDKNDVEGQDIFEKIEGIILVKGYGRERKWYAAVWSDQPFDIEHMTIREEMSEKVVMEDILEDEVDAKEVQEKDVIHKIRREDLAKLPHCEWKLANNHFLLHGYHNYHHLVSFEKEGTCWIGVPGLFHPEEQKAAILFGFGQFMRPVDGEIELSEEQKEENDEFGYWCRIVSEVVEG